MDLALCETGHAAAPRHQRGVVARGRLARARAPADQARALPAVRRAPVRVKTSEEIEGRRSFTGLLESADDDQVSVADPGDGVTIPLDAVRRSNLLEENQTEVSSVTQEIVDAVKALEAREGHRVRHPDGRARRRAALGLQEDPRRRQVREGRARPRNRGLPRLRAQGPRRPRDAAARRAVRGAASDRRGGRGRRRARARDPADRPRRRPRDGRAARGESSPRSSPSGSRPS